MALSRRAEAQLTYQVRRWHRREYGTGSHCIAISRLSGSGGAEVARRVGEALDFGVFGHELIDQISGDDAGRKLLLQDLDEQVRDGISRYVLDAVRIRRFTEGDYLEKIVHAVATLGERGMAVVLGRGAPFILSADRALRVLLVAPFERRVARWVELRDLSPGEAEKALREEDARRAEFHRYHFQRDYTDPTLYDLALNTDSLGYETSATMVVDAFRRRFGG